MGVIALSEDKDVPFPRRLFSALVRHEIDRGGNEALWINLLGKFEGGGCLLDLEELPTSELHAFKQGVRHLTDHIEDMGDFEGFEIDGVINCMHEINKYFSH